VVTRMGLKDLRRQAHFRQQGGDVLGRRALTRPGVVTPVGRVDPDQVAAQGGDLVLRGNVRACCLLGHLPIVAPAPAPAGGDR
jgi:hypothetical protein